MTRESPIIMACSESGWFWNKIVRPWYAWSFTGSMQTALISAIGTKLSLKTSLVHTGLCDGMDSRTENDTRHVKFEKLASEPSDVSSDVTLRNNTSVSLEQAFDGCRWYCHRNTPTFDTLGKQLFGQFCSALYDSVGESWNSYRKMNTTILAVGGLRKSAQEGAAAGSCKRIVGVAIMTTFHRVCCVEPRAKKADTRSVATQTDRKNHPTATARRGPPSEPASITLRCYSRIQPTGGVICQVSVVGSAMRDVNIVRVVVAQRKKKLRPSAKKRRRSKLKRSVVRTLPQSGGKAVLRASSTDCGVVWPTSFSSDTSDDDDEDDDDGDDRTERLDDEDIDWLFSWSDNPLRSPSVITTTEDDDETRAYNERIAVVNARWAVAYPDGPVAPSNTQVNRNVRSGI